jgi:transcriptional regulator
MLVHPWDSALDKDEWWPWLNQGRDFGQLISVGTEWPVVVPTHFVVDGDEVLVHLARPNPIWSSIQATGRAVLSVVDDYAYIPTYWRTGPEVAETGGVPTSYYSAVQLRCRAELVDDPAGKAELLRKQLRHFQPEGRYEEPQVQGEHDRLLSGIRGVRLSIVEALAKFKFDDHKPEALRVSISERLRQRGGTRDLSASAEQSRRLERKCE